MTLTALVFISAAALCMAGCDSDSAGPEPDTDGGARGTSFEAPAGDSPEDAGLWVDPGATPHGELPTEPACGPHGYLDGEDCVCEPGYAWCNASARDFDCCPEAESPAKPSLDPEDVTGLAVLGMRVRPFKYVDENGEPVPWDWDGSIPDWILNAVGLFAQVFPELQFWSEVLQKIDEYAPFLLEGQTPPDPYIRFSDRESQDPFYYGTSSYNSDTVEPSWEDAFVPLSSFADAGFVVVEVWDEDAVIDDFMGQFRVSLEYLYDLYTVGEWIDIESVPTLFAAEMAAY